MKILLTGSSGLVGSHLVPFFRADEHSVTRLVRRPALVERKEIAWDPAEGKLEPVALEGHDHHRPGYLDDFAHVRFCHVDPSSQ